MMLTKCWMVKLPACRPRSVTRLVCKIKKNGGKTRYARTKVVKRNNSCAGFRMIIAYMNEPSQRLLDLVFQVNARYETLDSKPTFACYISKPRDKTNCCSGRRLREPGLKGKQKVRGEELGGRLTISRPRTDEWLAGVSVR